MKPETIKILEQLTPAEKADAIEFLAGSLQRDAKNDPAAQNQAMRQLLQVLAQLPVHNPSDGFSSSDHDREIYREHR
jgi:hypothetical protein